MRQTDVTLHGHRVAYREAGDPALPVLLLIHGITSSSSTWDPVIPALAEHAHVIAPDLLGHGDSDKPRADYSLGGFASGLRDLLDHLGHERVTVIGHSLGGGVAMQFAYQHLIANHHVRTAGVAVGRVLGRIPIRPRPSVQEVARGYASLSESAARTAFVHTLRSVVEPGGQRVNASDRLYLAEGRPTLIVWGALDTVIPVSHAHHAHAVIPGSALEVFEQSGHFPHMDEPARFARVVRSFLGSTESVHLDRVVLRDRMAARHREAVDAQERARLESGQPGDEPRADERRRQGA